jgi:hypothetical protein
VLCAACGVCSASLSCAQFKRSDAVARWERGNRRYEMHMFEEMPEKKKNREPRIFYNILEYIILENVAGDRVIGGWRRLLPYTSNLTREVHSATARSQRHDHGRDFENHDAAPAIRREARIFFFFFLSPPPPPLTRWQRKNEGSFTLERMMMAFSRSSGMQRLSTSCATS